MKQKIETIAVTGGKGGTGKSTYAILLALQAAERGKKVLLVDCDVECPNDYLILGLEALENRLQETFAFYPKIDEEKCKRCGFCVKQCNSNAIFQVPGKIPQINRELCSSCGVCWHVCPEGAIGKTREKNGEIFVDKLSDKLTLITGRSIPGVRETSPVVSRTREWAEKKQANYDLCVIDTAAGTHCSVINALDGVDEAFAVTEPTPMGAHDLKVILQVLKVLKVPSKVVINQFDVGDSKLIEPVVKEQKVKIATKIPYSKDLAEAYFKGEFLDSSSTLLKLLK